MSERPSNICAKICAPISGQAGPETGRIHFDRVEIRLVGWREQEPATCIAPGLGTCQKLGEYAPHGAAKPLRHKPFLLRQPEQSCSGIDNFRSNRAT